VEFQFKKITAKEFTQQIKEGKARAVIKLSSKWSGTSHLMELALSALAIDYQDEVDFYQIDVDTDPGIRDEYRVEFVPAFLFFRDGNLVDMISGLIPRSTISSKIQLLINKS
jgi:thioredoxin 1